MFYEFDLTDPRFNTP
jgi:hypothetical protein